MQTRTKRSGHFNKKYFYIRIKLEKLKDTSNRMPFIIQRSGCFVKKIKINLMDMLLHTLNLI